MTPDARGMEPLLRILDLVKHFPVRNKGGDRKSIHAVDGVSFDLYPSETLAVVGETGCGKSTLARTIVRLLEPTSGHAYFNGLDLFRLNQREFRSVRRNIQLIFQDPYSSLNPRMTIRQLIVDAWQVHRDLVPRSKWRERSDELLDLVGLDGGYGERYPHQLSGGQRQRVSIARALAVSPQMLICDEPVSSLDASIQAQILNLLKRLQGELGLSCMFITHDLAVVRYVATRVAVMYMGKIVEIGDSEDIFERPYHPYTQALLSATLDARPWKHPNQRRIVLSGEVPSPADPPSGCRFRTRCWKSAEICARKDPALQNRGHGHPSACHFAELTATQLVNPTE